MMTFKEWLDEHDEYWDLPEDEQDKLYSEYRDRYSIANWSCYYY